ncbi:regulating synaptic membrane exocytosis protein 1-like [Osmerus eperlanus]|uniref:regulating synaptic membrane exocytosis protein 1-like n=1 Tax=Osmerus eperlanus TaxID=29151 RepID=UPI002E10F0E3
MPKEAGALLGLKVVGGRVTETGRLGAFITKVKKGSLADVVGHLRAGDEVLQWNGKLLPGATQKEVYNIILESQTEPQVELVVSRPIGDIPRIPDTSHPPLESTGSSSFESQKMERPSISVMTPSSPTLRDTPHFLPGSISVKLWYDKLGHQLIVNILQAVDLPTRPDGRPRNPYVKMYFLPDRSDKSKRRTKTVKKSGDPKWHQGFVYSHVHRRDFRNHMLEITVWDQPHMPEQDSLFMGEVLIELETALLDDQPHWYKLQTHDSSSIPLPRPSPYLPRRHAHTDTPTKKLQRSQRVAESEIDEGTTAVPKAADGRGRERQREQPSTLEVPEQRGSHHRSRSVSPPREEQANTRSRPPNIPAQRSLDDDMHHGRRSRSPTRYYDSTRGRQQEEEYLDDRQPQTLDTSSCQTLAQKPSDNNRGHLQGWCVSLFLRDLLLGPRRARQLPQVPARSSSVEQALAAEERVLPLQIKVLPYRSSGQSSSSQDLQRALKDKRELYKDQNQKRSCDNVSHKSSDSDVSDVSAISPPLSTSSASRVSSTSYMSIQSERPQGRHSRAVRATERMMKSTSVSGEIYGIEHIRTAANQTRRWACWGAGPSNGAYQPQTNEWWPSWESPPDAVAAPPRSAIQRRRVRRRASLATSCRSRGARRRAWLWSFPAQPLEPAGQPRVHRRQHQQLQLRGESDLFRDASGRRQPVQRLPGWTWPRPASGPADFGHTLHGRRPDRNDG